MTLPGRVWSGFLDLPRRIGRPVSPGAYQPQIDGMRFLAIAVVLVWHASLRASRYSDYWNSHGESIPNLYSYFPHGEVGVDLFFFISGYIITQPFLRKPRQTWDIRRFYVRRFVRIYPPYFVAITLCFLLILASGYHNQRHENIGIYDSLAASVFLVHGLLLDRGSAIDPPIWSLEIEIYFYLIAPILLYIYLLNERARFIWRLFFGSLVILLLIIISSIIDLIYPFDHRFRYGLLCHSYLFLAGIIVADHAVENNPINRSSSIMFDGLLIGGLAALFASGLYMTRVDARPGGGWPDILGDLLTLSGVLAIYFGSMRGAYGRIIMGNPWLCLIGTMCFSIYLIHIAILEGGAALMLHLLRLHTAPMVWCVHLLILIPMALCAGTLFYVFIERPFMNGRFWLRGTVKA